MKQNLNASVEIERVNAIVSFLIERGFLLEEEKNSATRIVNGMVDYCLGKGEVKNENVVVGSADAHTPDSNGNQSA